MTAHFIPLLPQLLAKVLSHKSQLLFGSKKDPHKNVFSCSLEVAFVTPEMMLKCLWVNLLFSSSLLADLQYTVDAEKVSLLLNAPLYFDLEMYSNASKVLKKVAV